MHPHEKMKGCIIMQPTQNVLERAFTLHSVERREQRIMVLPLRAIPHALNCNLFSYFFYQLNQPVAVSRFVVVPGEDFNQIPAYDFCGFRVEDAAGRVSDNVLAY